MSELLPELLGLTASEAAGFAIGVALGPALAPIVEDLRNDTWSVHPSKALDPELAARAVAEGRPLNSDPMREAGFHGYDADRFGDMVQMARKYPGIEMLLDLQRRFPDLADHVKGALNRLGLSDTWAEYVLRLLEVHLSPQEVALGIVRSLMEDPGFLPVNLDTSGGKVKSYPVSGIDPVAEAAKTGIDAERLRVMVGEIGLPMALEAAAGAVFRGIIRRPDFNRAVLEGDTRPEWADAIFEQSRAIPSPSDYVNAHIRGWITEAEMNAGTARHGMSADDTHLLYLRTGRPAAPGQMAAAAARGIDGPDGRPMDRAQFLKGIAESDIRPEWGPMLWESRFLYPPLFQISRLVEAGEITPEKGAEWLVKDRYPPDVVATIKAAWEKPTASTKQTHVQKAQTQLWTATHRAYMAGEATEQEARGMLTHAGVPDAQVDAVIGVWGNELQLVRKQLTATQLRKAWKNVLTNPGTGKPWTRDEVVARLEAMGYSAADAVTFIEEV